MKFLHNILSILTLLLILIALAAVFYVTLSFRELQDTLVREIQNSQEEIERSQEEIERLSRNFTLFAEENNELRLLLGHPVVVYEELPRSVHELEDMRASLSNFAYFHAVEFLVAQAARSERANSSPLAPFRTVQRMNQRSLNNFFIAQGKTELEEVFNDSGFIAYLNTKNLILSQEPFEDTEFVFFDFLNLEGRRIGSIGIQKRASGIYLFDDEYVSLGAIQTFGQRSRGSSTSLRLNLDSLPSDPYERGRSHIVLIAGTNQQLTDTLILVMVNEDTQTIDLVSLPRDLFYRNRKINEYYLHYGPRQLVREIESMTGFDIDNFIIIDMYAFIDVVNILGGVEITLDAPLVDPTYRVRDNGRWSTLFYPAGKHHLNGIEALRVARSRHFITDFGRSRHQQLILSAIIDQITSLGVSDIGRVYELAVVLLRYVETDYTPHNLVRTFLRFRSAKVRSQTVFDTGNILYSTHTNLLRLGLREDEVDEGFNLGQYILLPFNHDWSLINRFIRYNIEGPVLEDNDEDNDIEDHSTEDH